MPTIKIFLRGFGQVMLQNNALTGALFLAGIFYNSWLMALGAILGALASVLAAVALKYSNEDIKNGLYGFNGVLVGIAVWFYFETSVISTIAIIVGAIISTIIMRFMKEKMPAFTAPFVISSWLLIIGLKFFNLASSTIFPPFSDDSLDLLSAIGQGFGQVMFQGSVITGLIFLLAIMVNSRIAALYAFYGSFLGVILAMLFTLPFGMINIGLFGYNAVLCGIALGDKHVKAFVLATLAIVLSVLLNWWLGSLGIITLTAPFVLATWVILLIKKLLNQ